MAKVNRDDVDKFHDYGLYIPKRVLYMGSEDISMEHGESGVDGLMAERIIKNMSLLDSINNEPITIIMNNPGGDWYHGVGIYDAIKNAKSHVTIKVLGMAMSMGSVILQAADDRIIAPSAKMMIHYGETGIPETHSKNVKKWADENDRINVEMENIYMEKMKVKNPELKLKQLQKMLNFDTILSAKEAVDLGLADKIIGEENE